MAGFGSVSPGDKWRPSAKWLNAINRLLNAQGGVVQGMTSATNAANKVQVYNAGSSALVAGAAVELVTSGAQMIGGMIPCSALSNVNLRWGVLANHLDPQKGGGCVIAGPVSVSSITGSGAMYVLPVVGSGAIVSGAQVWSRTPVGVPLLGGTASGGVVLLGSETEIRFAAVATMPTGGTGAGTVRLAMPTISGGVIVDSSTSLPMVMPYIDGAN